MNSSYVGKTKVKQEFTFSPENWKLTLSEKTRKSVSVVIKTSCGVKKNTLNNWSIIILLFIISETLINVSPSKETWVRIWLCKISYVFAFCIRVTMSSTISIYNNLVANNNDDKAKQIKICYFISRSKSHQQRHFYSTFWSEKTHRGHSKPFFRQRYPLICIIHKFGINLQGEEEAFSFHGLSSEEVSSRQAIKEDHKAILHLSTVWVHHELCAFLFHYHQDFPKFLDNYQPLSGVLGSYETW